MDPMISTFDSTKEPLAQILNEAAHGKTQLPDFQRGWVWDDEHIKDLLASVSRGFPIGTVMMLESGADDVQFKPRPIEGAGEGHGEPERLLLDGQQRITSLFQSLQSGQPVRTRDPRGRVIERWYYLDINACLDDEVEREDAIVSIPADRIVRSNFGREIALDASTPEKEFAAELFPLRQVFDSSDWHEGYIEYWEYSPDKFQRWKEFSKRVLKAFEHFQLPVIELKRETPKEAVCLVFEKVNTGGVSLTVFELLTATFAASGFDLREDWRARKARIDERRILTDVASTDFLQALTLLTTYQRREQALSEGSDAPPQVTCKRRDVLRLQAEDYQRWANTLERAFKQAAKFLHGQHVFDPRFLPYTSQLVPLAALMSVLGTGAEKMDAKHKLEQWYWCGVFGELYGSTTETRFARDLVDVVQWIHGGALPRTIEDANFAQQRLKSMRTRNSAAYRGLYTLLLREGAKDLRTCEESTIHTYFDENVDIHHLFPKKWCQERDIEPGIYDSIVNKTPLSARTNRIIGGNAPSEYLSRLERNHGIDPVELDENLRSHFIDPESMRRDDFRSLFEQRGDRLLAAIAKVMGKDPEEGEEEGWLPELSYADVEPEPTSSEEVA